MLHGKYFAREEQQPQGREVERVEVTELGQQAENRRCRVPHRNALLGDHGGEPQRLFAKLLADEDDRGAVLDADVEVEDRQVEVKGRMGRKTILRPRREFVRAPVHEAERRAVAVRSEEHTSEPQSLMRISYAVF